MKSTVRSHAFRLAVFLSLVGTAWSGAAFAAPEGATPKAKGTASSTGEEDLKHEPVTEAPVGKPLPVSVSKASPAKKLVVYYLPPDSEDWAKAKMSRAGKEWRALLPCSATAHTGALQYYVVGEDEDGEIVKHAGSKAHPFEVALKKKLRGEPPSFTGEEPPTSCDEAPDCTANSQDSACKKPEDKDDSSGEEHPKDAGDEGPSKNWLTLGISVDLAHVSGGNVCSPGNYANATFACFRQSDGRLYEPVGAADPGTVSGIPFVVGTVRILGGYDRVVTGNLAVGIRLGFAFNGGPSVPSSPTDRGFVPFHIEPRATYWIGEHVLSETGFRPYVFLGGGLAEVDGKLSGVQVSTDCDLQGLCRSSRTPSAPVYNPDGTPKTHADGSQVYVTPHGVDISTLPAKPMSKITVDAYRKLGTGFVGIGGGLMYAVEKNLGVTLDLKIAYFLGSTGVAVSPTLGGIVGFLELAFV